MTQQINLFDPSLRPARELLTLPNVLIALAGAALLVAALGVLGMMRSADELRNFRATDARLRQAQEQLTLFAVQQAARKPDAGLEQQLARTRQVIEAKRTILQRLQQGDFGDRQGFLAYFRGLALVAVDGLWLTGFDVAAGGQALEIRGRMLNEAALPRYVEALRGQPAFAGRTFAALNVTRVEAPANAGESERAGPPQMAFSLSGTPAETPAGGGKAR